MQDKGKRNIVDSHVGEQSCNMKEDHIIMKASLQEEEKRKQRI